MRNATNDRSAAAAPQPIDTASLQGVTGGCAACGSAGAPCLLLNRFRRDQPTPA